MGHRLGGLSEATCSRRRQIYPARRFLVTRRGATGIVAGRGMAATEGGSVKSQQLGKSDVGDNNQDKVLRLIHSRPRTTHRLAPLDALPGYETAVILWSPPTGRHVCSLHSLANFGHLQHLV